MAPSTASGRGKLYTRIGVTRGVQFYKTSSAAWLERLGEFVTLPFSLSPLAHLHTFQAKCIKHEMELKANKR